MGVIIIKKFKAYLAYRIKPAREEAKNALYILFNSIINEFFMGGKFCDRKSID